MRHALALLCIIVLACNACKKPLPSGNNELPKFYFAGTIDNQRVVLEAGVSNIYMHTLCFVDKDGLLTLNGNLAHETKLDSGVSLQVSFKNLTADTNRVTNIENFLIPNTFLSYSKDSNYNVNTNYKAVQYLFTGNKVGAVSYKWNLGDGFTSNDINPKVVYNSEGEKVIALKVKYSNGWEDFLVNKVNITFNTNHDGQITIDRTNKDTLLCTANGTNITWQLPDGTTVNGNNLIYTQPVTNRQYLKASGIINGKPYNYQQLLAPTLSDILVNFNFSSTDSIKPTLIPGANNFGKAIITYKTNEKTYVSYKQSNLLKQNSNKVLDIKEAIPFIQDNAGLSTYSLTTSVDGYLYNIKNDADSIKIKSDRMSIAVGYK